MPAHWLDKILDRLRGQHRDQLIMTLLVRNEEDILADTLEYHRAQGIDHFIVTNNLSEDATPRILDHYRSRGWLSVIEETRDDYDQQAWVTRMARMAAEPAFNAEWIIHSDADEFWCADGMTVKQYFKALPQETNVVSARRHDFVPLRQVQGPWHQQMIFRKAVSLSPRGGPLPPKVAHRPFPEVVIAQGNHAVSGIPDPVVAETGVEILHFPMRCQAQMELKIARGGAAYERNTIQPKTIATGWRQLYRELRSEGSLNAYYGANSFDLLQLEDALHRSELVKDERLADFFRRHGSKAKRMSAN